MAIDQSNFEQVQEADLDQLITGQVPEGLHIEYKLRTYGNTDADKREFLKDVTGLANTMGGHLLLGIDAQAGIPRSIPGLPGINTDDELQRLEQILQSSVDPRIPGVRLRRIALRNGEHAIAIRVPRSWSLPHMVTFRGINRFHRRNSAGCYEASLEELRAMFNTDSQISSQFQAFRESRIAHLRGGGSTYGRNLEGNGQLILHVFPLSSFAGGSRIDLGAVMTRQSEFAPLEAGTASTFRFNIDGALTERGYPNLYGYTQIYRNGRIESTKGNIIQNDNRGRSALPAYDIEHKSILTLRRIVWGLQAIDVPPPYFVALSVLGCSNARYHVRTDPFADPPPPIYSDIAALPEGRIDTFGTNENYDAALKPAFDCLWNSAGHTHDQWFSPSGEWVGPPPNWPY